MVEATFRLRNEEDTATRVKRINVAFTNRAFQFGFKTDRRKICRLAGVCGGAGLAFAVQPFRKFGNRGISLALVLFSKDRCLG
ncbi:hypothetical protein D3C80_1855770 [compost metagenome]